MRRAGCRRANVWAQAVAVSRAIVLMRPAGKRDRSTPLTPSERISATRSSASSNAGELIRVGARRSRSNGEKYSPSVVANNASSLAVCSRGQTIRLSTHGQARHRGCQALLP